MKNYNSTNYTKNQNLQKWFHVKSKISQLQKIEKPPIFKEKQVWRCNVGENVGVEINGKGESFLRPVLIFVKLNKYTFLGIPLTSQPHHGSWYVPFIFRNKNNRAVLSQVRVFSAKRLHSRMGELTSGDFAKIRDGFIQLYLKNNPS